MLERNKHNGFSTVIFKTCYSKNALKGAFCNLRFFHMEILKAFVIKKPPCTGGFLWCAIRDSNPGHPD